MIKNKTKSNFVLFVFTLNLYKLAIVTLKFNLKKIIYQKKKKSIRKNKKQSFFNVTIIYQILKIVK